MASAEWANAEKTFVLYFDDGGTRYVVLPDDVRLNGLVLEDMRITDATIVPRSVTRFQALSVMLQTIRSSGRSMYSEALEMLTGAVAQVSSLPESDPARRAADLNLLAFTAADTFERSSALISSIGAALDLDDGQIDRLFILAASVAR